MTEKRYLGIDFETYSETDIKTAGSFRYMEDPAFELLLGAYAYDDEEESVVDYLAGDDFPNQVIADLTNPDVIKTAWNCAFERYAIQKHYGIYSPPEQWEDTMILAGQCGLPMSLGGASDALGLGDDQAKMKEGRALIRYFCNPCKPTKSNGQRTRNLPEHAPDKWELFKEYNGQDVVAERAIRKLLQQWKPLPEEHRFWCLDAKINERGVRIDKTLASYAVAMDNRNKAELTEEAIQLTGLENPKSVSQIKKWLFDQEGQEFPSLNKKVIADVVSQLQSEDAKKFMALRSELSKSSVAKYNAMLRSMCPDDHVRGCFQFYGANRTGRFAGRLVQFQNLSKNYMEDLDECRELVKAGHYTSVKALYDGVADPLSQLVRTAMIPEEGHKFLISDFSAIEARVIAWFANEQWRLKVFSEGGDIYCASASQMFHVPVEKHGQNAHLRQKGKVAELALGYGGGVNALKAFGADKMGMTEAEMQETVDLWRESSPNIVAMWKSLEKAAIKAIVRRSFARSSIGNILFTYDKGVLFMTLPSGRRLAYWGAKYEPSKWHPDRKAISYMGVDQQTKKWSRIETWGGKLTENCWSAGTPVLTDRGWTPIEAVTSDMQVWDGVEWVGNDGVECQPREDVLFELDGLLVTGDHKILTTEGWRNAKECDGLDRLPVQLPHGFGAERVHGHPRTEKMVGKMRLRKSVPEGCSRHSEKGEAWRRRVLRLSDERVYLEGQDNAWTDRARGARGMALDEAAMHRPEPSGMEKLRWSWNYGVRAVVAQLRELLGGHGPDVSTGAGLRSRKQRSRVLPGELQMGDSIRELSKQTTSADDHDQRRNDPSERTGGTDGHRVHDTTVPTGSRLSVRKTDLRSGHNKPVYDVKNCGPRHRYVVLGASGPIIAHNCVQATARDCLRDSMLALDEAGYDIRMHIHDEVVVTEPIDGRSVEDMNELMGRAAPWAEGLPLDAAGYEGSYYFKD